MKEPNWDEAAEACANDWRNPNMNHDRLSVVISRHLSAAYALGKSHGLDWLPIADAPRDGRTIIVEGGTAYWTGRAWYSDQAQAKIQWPVKIWILLPPSPEPKP